MPEIPRYQSMTEGRAIRHRVITKPTGFQVPELDPQTVQETSLENMSNVIANTVGGILQKKAGQERQKKAIQNTNNLLRITESSLDEMMNKKLADTDHESYSELFAKELVVISKKIEDQIAALPSVERHIAEEFYLKKQVQVAQKAMNVAEQRDDAIWVAENYQLMTDAVSAGSIETAQAAYIELYESNKTDLQKLNSAYTTAIDQLLIDEQVDSHVHTVNGRMEWVRTGSSLPEDLPMTGRSVPATTTDKDIVTLKPEEQLKLERKKIASPEDHDSPYLKEHIASAEKEYDKKLERDLNHTLDNMPTGAVTVSYVEEYINKRDTIQSILGNNVTESSIDELVEKEKEESAKPIIIDTPTTASFKTLVDAKWSAVDVAKHPEVWKRVSRERQRQRDAYVHQWEKANPGKDYPKPLLFSLTGFPDTWDGPYWDDIDSQHRWGMARLRQKELRILSSKENIKDYE